VNEEFQQEPTPHLNVFQNYLHNFKHILKNTYKEEKDCTEMYNERSLF